MIIVYITGVETLSVQQKGTFQRRSSQLSPISDADISFDFSIEESNGDSSPPHDGNVHRDRFPSLDDGLPVS